MGKPKVGTWIAHMARVERYGFLVIDSEIWSYLRKIHIKVGPLTYFLSMKLLIISKLLMVCLYNTFQLIWCVPVRIIIDFCVSRFLECAIMDVIQIPTSWRYDVLTELKLMFWRVNIKIQNLQGPNKKNLKNQINTFTQNFQNFCTAHAGPNVALPLVWCI